MRIPAALNGGLRSSADHGSHQQSGRDPGQLDFDTVGPLARRAEDIARVLQVLAGYDPHDLTSIDQPVGDYLAGLNDGVKGWRIGLLGGHFQTEPQSVVVTLIKQAACVFEELGPA